MNYYTVFSNRCGLSSDHCQVLADPALFGDLNGEAMDACPDTPKYLEVHYRCVADDRTTPDATNGELLLC